MLPGISMKKTMALEPKLQKVILKHITDYKAVLKEKDRFLSEKDPKDTLFGFGGFRKIDDFIRETEGPLEDRLLVLKGALLDLRTSVDRELAINSDFETLSKKAKTDKTLYEQLERLKGEFADEYVLLGMTYTQSELIDQIHSIVTEISPLAREYPHVSAYCSELDNFCTLMKNTILDREIKVLELIGNLVNLPRVLRLDRKAKGLKKAKKAARKR